MDADRCNGCGECYKVGCIAVENESFEDRTVARINHDLCVGCTLCVQVCPENAIAPMPITAELVPLGLMSG